MSAYFDNIKEAATSLFNGFAITLSNMLKKPTTVQYPDRLPRPMVDLIPERSRSWLRVEMDICTACLNCEKACPINCIKITPEKDPGLGRVMTGFDIDMAKCMYCGLCTEPCPTGAIHFIPEFEKAAFSLDAMVSHFIPEGDKIVPYKAPRKERDESEGEEQESQTDSENTEE